MKIEKLYQKSIKGDNTILCATSYSENEAIIVLSNADVIHYDFQTDKTIVLFSLVDNMGYTDQGFDISSPISIYTLDNIVVIVNDFKRHGYIYNPDQQYKLHLWRGEYYANITKYPIVLYKDKKQIPHLIYGEDWNHIQIINLNTRQIITASKSLIEEGTEEKHIEYYKTHKETNKLSWPSTYDYFYSKLTISPDNKYFASAGWIWGSADCCKAYEIDDFVTNSHIKDINLFVGEHENRSMCWIDNDTIAIEYNPYIEDEANEDGDLLQEIHLYRIENDEVKLLEKIKIEDKDIQYDEMYFNSEFKSFILLNKSGIINIISFDGQVILKKDTKVTNVFNSKYQQFTSYHDKIICVYKIK